MSATCRQPGRVAALLVIALIGIAGCGRQRLLDPPSSAPSQPLHLYRVRLTGRAEIPKGAANGSGSAIIAIHRGSVCVLAICASPRLPQPDRGPDPCRFQRQGRARPAAPLDRATASPSGLHPNEPRRGDSDRARSVQLLRGCAQPAVPGWCGKGTVVVVIRGPHGAVVLWVCLERGDPGPSGHAVDVAARRSCARGSDPRTRPWFSG